MLLDNKKENGGNYRFNGNKSENYCKHLKQLIDEIKSKGKVAERIKRRKTIKELLMMVLNERLGESNVCHERS